MAKADHDFTLLAQRVQQELEQDATDVARRLGLDQLPDSTTLPNAQAYDVLDRGGLRDGPAFLLGAAKSNPRQFAEYVKARHPDVYQAVTQAPPSPNPEAG